MMFLKSYPSLPFFLLLVIFLPGLLASAADADQLQEERHPYYTCQELTPDMCELTAEQGKLRFKGIDITYWKYAKKSQEEDNTTANANLLPIVALHGGPAFTHNYMLPLQQQACRGRPIYFYDQAGCGKSRPSFENGTLMTDKQVVQQFPFLLDPDYYATQELPALLEHWKLHSSEFHIVANSWGTMLAQLYVLHSPAAATVGLQSLVLSGPLSDCQTYIQAQWDPVDGNLGNLPDFLQKRIKVLEHQSAYQSHEYHALDKALGGYFTLRTQPHPDCWIHSNQGNNEEIYVAMQGPSEFTAEGVLKYYNVTGELPKITVPVLLTHGKYDTMRPSIVKTMQEQLPNAQRVYLERSGHVSMIDEPEKMNNAVADFYDQVEVNLTQKEEAAKESLFYPPSKEDRWYYASTVRNLYSFFNRQSTAAGTTSLTSTGATLATPFPLLFISVSLALVVGLVAGFLLGDHYRRAHC